MKSSIRRYIRHYLLENNQDNFSTWFSGSKIVNSDGSPMLVYHGSDYKFTNFDFAQIGKSTGNFGHYGHGMYFSDDIREAKVYGKIIYECYLKIKNPYTDTDEQRDELAKAGFATHDRKSEIRLDFDSLYQEVLKKDKIGAEFLLILKEYGYENGWSQFLKKHKTFGPIDPNDLYDVFIYTIADNAIPEYVFQELRDMGIDPDNIGRTTGYIYKTPLHFVTDLGNMSESVTLELKKLGYDGVIYGSEYVAFYPEQIFIKNKL